MLDTPFFKALKELIQTSIYSNTGRLITGDLLQSVLLGMVNGLGGITGSDSARTYLKVSVPNEDTLETYDKPVFIILNGAGTYNNLGGLVVTEEQAKNNICVGINTYTQNGEAVTWTWSLNLWPIPVGSSGGLQPTPNDNQSYIQLNGNWVNPNNVYLPERNIVDIYQGNFVKDVDVNLTHEQVSLLQIGMVVTAILSDDRYYKGTLRISSGIPIVTAVLYYHGDSSYPDDNVGTFVWDREYNTAKFTPNDNYNGMTLKASFESSNLQSLSSYEEYVKEFNKLQLYDLMHAGVDYEILLGEIINNNTVDVKRTSLNVLAQFSGKSPNDNKTYVQFNGAATKPKDINLDPEQIDLIHYSNQGVVLEAGGSIEFSQNIYPDISKVSEGAIGSLNIPGATNPQNITAYFERTSPTTITATFKLNGSDLAELYIDNYDNVYHSSINNVSSESITILTLSILIQGSNGEAPLQILNFGEPDITTVSPAIDDYNFLVSSLDKDDPNSLIRRLNTISIANLRSQLGAGSPIDGQAYVQLDGQWVLPDQIVTQARNKIRAYIGDTTNGQVITMSSEDSRKVLPNHIPTIEFQESGVKAYGPVEVTPYYMRSNLYQFGVTTGDVLATFYYEWGATASFTINEGATNCDVYLIEPSSNYQSLMQYKIFGEEVNDNPDLSNSRLIIGKTNDLFSEVSIITMNKLLSLAGKSPLDDKAYVQFNGRIREPGDLINEETTDTIASGTTVLPSKAYWAIPNESYRTSIKEDQIIRIELSGESSSREATTYIESGYIKADFKDDSTQETFLELTVEPGVSASFYNYGDSDITVNYIYRIMPRSTKENIVQYKDFLNPLTPNDYEFNVLSSFNNYGSRNNTAVGSISQSRLKNYLGNNYSYIESLTGRTFSDGKNTYQKTIDLGTLPNNTTNLVPHGISDLDTLVGIISGSAKSSTGRQIVLPYVDDSFVSIALEDATNLSVKTNSDMSTYTGIITIEYTKNV